MRPDTEDPIVDLVARLRESYGELCDVAPSPVWWYFKPRQSGYVMPEQGWKLHVSATLANAPDVLGSVAERLIRRPTAWKVARDLDQLATLCSVPSAVSQVGKFITIYPADDRESIALAHELHEVTGQFTGPRVPSDRQFRPRSLVSYRYGGFASTTRYDADGIRMPSIIGPDGTLVADVRQAGRWRPDWVADPFPRFDEQQSTTGPGLFGRNLAVRGLLRQSAKGGVYAVSRDGQNLVLKEGRFGTNPDALGRDARDRLSNEFEVLRRLAPLGIAPRPIEVFDAEDNRYLLMEHLPGISLRSYLEELERHPHHAGRGLDRIAELVSGLVDQCHAAGVVLRDLSPNNILVAGDSCSLVDLELAHITDAGRPPFAGYTPGYARHGAPPDGRITTDDDHYALGACLFFAATGTDPYLGPDQDALPRIDDLLATVPHRPRAATVAVARARLAPPTPTATPPGARVVREQAIAAADHLIQTAAWESRDYLWSGTGGELLFPGCFQDGATGIAYFLCDVAQATGQPRFYEAARTTLDWTLTTHQFRVGETPRGLYFGYAALPWVLARVAVGLHQPDLLEQAATLALSLTDAPGARLDVTHGAAGIGLTCLELYDRTADARLLARAHALAEQIADAAETDMHGTITWSDEGRRMWGYAHGVAGLAAYVLETALRTGDARLHSVAGAAFRGLVRAATPMRGGAGVSWTKDVGGTEVPWPHWCNGAAGVGATLLRAARSLDDPELEQAAVRAAQTVRLGHLFRTTCQCHGLAGDADFVLQLGRELGRPDMLRAARRLSRRVLAQRIETEQQPAWTWLTEGSGPPSAGFMTGYTGVYSFLLRVAHAELRPPLTLQPARLVAGIP